MGCYAVPAAAAIIHYYMRKKNPNLQTKQHKWLNLLFIGGSIFGIVDHIWNGDLLSFSWSDILLGFVITATIMLSWGVMVYYDKTPEKSTSSA